MMIIIPVQYSPLLLMMIIIPLHGGGMMDYLGFQKMVSVFVVLFL